MHLGRRRLATPPPPILDSRFGSNFGPLRSQDCAHRPRSGHQMASPRDVCLRKAHLDRKRGVTGRGPRSGFVGSRPASGIRAAGAFGDAAPAEGHRSRERVGREVRPAAGEEVRGGGPVVVGEPAVLLLQGDADGGVDGVGVGSGGRAEARGLIVEGGAEASS